MNKENIETALRNNNKYCTACTACVNVCPYDAIELQHSGVSAYIANIKEDRCVHCGLCTKVCPQIEMPVSNNKSQPNCYAVWATNEIRQISSSGGAFSILAEHFLKAGGIVAGCAYGDDLLPEHIVVTTLEELPKLRKSKYTQSNLQLVFRKIKEYLDKGQRILFSGVPCQIAGLKKYLGKEYDSLYTVDIVCSGSVPIGIYERYLKELEETYHKKIKTLDFRDKRNGWSCGHLVIKFEDGSEVNENPNLYMQALIRGDFRRDACLNCEAAAFPKLSDITIGDFWGVSRYNAEYNDGNGTSLLIVNSNKGETLFNEVRHSFQMSENVPFEFTRDSNWFSVVRERKAESKRLYDLMGKMPVRDALNKTLGHRYDICIVGNWSGFNYGAHLTHYALWQTLTDLGYDVLMLEKPDEEPFRPLSEPRLFANNPYPDYALAPLFKSLKDMKSINCDTFVVGSDQLWNYKLFGHAMEFYALAFVENKKKKISYATSLGTEDQLNGMPETKEALFRVLLNRFDAVSVRENAEILRTTFGVEAEHVLDPVFLCNTEYYLHMIEKSKLHITGEYIFAYLIHPNEAKLETIEAISKHLNKRVVVICDALQHYTIKGYGSIEVLEKPKIEDWLKVLYNSSLVIADSFHAYAFSVIFQKQIMPIYTSKCGAERCLSLASFLGLPKPVVLDRKYDTEPQVLINNTMIDYGSINSRIDEKREFSIKWLQNAIKDESNKGQKPETELIVDSCLRIDALKKTVKTQDEKIERLKDQLTGHIDRINQLNGQIKTLDNRLNSFDQKYNMLTSVRIKRAIIRTKRCIREHGVFYTGRKILFHIKRHIHKTAEK